MSVLVLGGLKDVVIFACALFMGLFVGFTETAVSKNDLAVFDLQRRIRVRRVFFYIGCCVIEAAPSEEIETDAIRKTRHTRCHRTTGCISRMVRVAVHRRGVLR